MPCGVFSLKENEALGFGRSLLHKLGYPNPSMWCKLGFLTLASPTSYLGNLQGKLEFLTLASSTHYFSLLGKLLALLFFYK